MKLIPSFDTRTLSFMKVGGECDFYCEITSEKQLGHLFSLAEVSKLHICGGGSNTVFGDRVFGVVAVLKGELSLAEVNSDTGEILCGGGASLAYVSRLAQIAGLSGLEGVATIPASIGGGVKTSCGAFGFQLADAVSFVEVATKNGKVRLSNAECNFGYRKSEIPRGIITKVGLSLEKSDSNEIKSRMQEFAKIRRDTQPLNLPSCGSVFKRENGIIPAQLIESAGLKGYRVGGLEVSQKHAGFVCNVGGGTPSDYIQIVSDIKREVAKKFSVVLCEEVEFCGVANGK